VGKECFTHSDGETQGLMAKFYNNLDLSGVPVLTRIDPTVNAWWGNGGPATGIVDAEHFSIRWTGVFTAPVSGEITFYLGNTGAAMIWLDGKLILENDVGPIPTSAGDPGRRGDSSAIKLRKGKQYSFKAEFSSGENNAHARVKFSSMITINLDGDLIERAVNLAKASDAAVIVAGLPDFFETEGHDRPDMDLPGEQEALIRAVAAANPNTVVVVNACAPVAMPWVDEVDAVLLSYYPGQEGGYALAELLFGDVNPSGKLTVSFPKQLKDNPAYTNYPGRRDVHYGERIFVGYRYYDFKDVDPLFAFGHGLSYTHFEYSDLSIPSCVKPGEVFEVSVTVKNIGDVAGKEIVQLYIRDEESTLVRPIKELKGFEKVPLASGESRTVTFHLNPRALSYYDPHYKDWIEEEGIFEVLIGASSRDLRLHSTFELAGD